MKIHGDNIFKADLSDDIARALVKFIDNKQKWLLDAEMKNVNMRNKKRGRLSYDDIERAIVATDKSGTAKDIKEKARKLQRFTSFGGKPIGEVGGWNAEGRRLYFVLKGCMEAIGVHHWEDCWQTFWKAHPDNIINTGKALDEAADDNGMQDEEEMSEEVTFTPI